MIYWKPLTPEEINKFKENVKYKTDAEFIFFSIETRECEIIYYHWDDGKLHYVECGEYMPYEIDKLLNKYTHFSDINYETNPEVFFQYALKEKTKQVMGLLETNPEVFEERK